ncbi:MAG: hypothetical protein JXR76_21805 [Deltaproteobacteria bacterium]|nr:hypothetical protein [Deltaproteobacteria bacterium]
MVAITDPMVDENKDRNLLEGYVPTAGIVPYVIRAHNTLLQVQETPTDAAQNMRVYMEKAAALDERHDECYRLFHATITGLSVVEDEAEAKLLIPICDTLLPDGLLGPQNAYLAKAGRVELATSRMTPEMEVILKESVVRDKTLYQLFTDWADAGRALAELERERVRFNEKKRTLEP